MRRIAFFTVVLSATLLAVMPATGRMPKPETVVQVRVEPAQVALKPGTTTAVTLLADIKDGFHINSTKPIQDYLIPTRVELLTPAPFVVEKASFPAGELKGFGFAPDEKLSVYEGTVRVTLQLRAKPEALAGAHDLRLAFHYQACNDRFCLRPARREATLKVLLQ